MADELTSQNIYNFYIGHWDPCQEIIQNLKDSQAGRGIGRCADLHSRTGGAVYQGSVI